MVEILYMPYRRRTPSRIETPAPPALRVLHRPARTDCCSSRLPPCQGGLARARSELPRCTRALRERREEKLLKSQPAQALYSATRFLESPFGSRGEPLPSPDWLAFEFL